MRRWRTYMWRPRERAELGSRAPRATAVGTPTPLKTAQPDAAREQCTRIHILTPAMCPQCYLLHFIIHRVQLTAQRGEQRLPPLLTPITLWQTERNMVPALSPIADLRVPREEAIGALRCIAGRLKRRKQKRRDAGACWTSWRLRSMTSA